MKKWLIMAFVFFIGYLNAQDKKTETIVFQTSARCGECKERIENKLNYTKGVVFAELDMETKKLTIRYKTNKITKAKLQEVISNIGYDADEVKANPEAVAKLPDCCKPNGKECK